MKLIITDTNCIMKKFIYIILISILISSCDDKLIPTLPSPASVIVDSILDSTLIHLKYGQEAYIEKKLIIKFESVTSDSRCPKDVVCVWEGDGSVQLKLINNQDEIFTFLHTTLEPKEISFNNYQIKLKELNPYPISTEKILKEDYSIKLVIKR